MFASGTSVVVGEKYRYPETGTLLWQGTVESFSTVTYSSASYLQVVFKDVIGKLGRKWNAWYGSISKRE